MKMVDIRGFEIWRYTCDHPDYNKIWDMAFFRVKVATALIFLRIHEGATIEESN